DFLARIGQLRHNYSNYVRLIAESREKTNHRGIFDHSVGWYQAHQPEYYERFKRLLLDICNLLPSLPMSSLDAIDEEMAEKIRRFEEEALAVIVRPVADMAMKALTRTLVGEGLITEQAMIVYFNLKDADFTRKGFSKVIARVISNRDRLFFRKNVPDTLLASNINVLQGQLDGHCSHLMSLLTSRDMSGYVQSTLRAIRYRHLPVIMAQVIKELAALEAHRDAIFAHSLFRESISIKDLVLHNTTITPGYLAECAAAIEPLTRPFDPAAPDNVDLQVVELRVVEHVSRALEQLDRFGMGVNRLPVRELDLKVKFLRTEFDAAIDACLAFLGSYNGIFDKVEDAVRPLLGLISFDAGGQSDFYARWFPGMNNLLARDNLISEYATAVERLRSQMAHSEEEDGEAIKENLRSWLTPEVMANAEGASPHIRHFASEGLIEVLASAFVFITSLSEAPSWFHELERRIFHDIDQKRSQAQEVITAGKN
ncbi:MAG: hypothetical protein HOH74_31435, partial [Gemmatimonadetes bacterium]|nr:hypothetical protein [Gemmatimonadota bacterium]